MTHATAAVRNFSKLCVVPRIVSDFVGFDGYQPWCRTLGCTGTLVNGYDSPLELVVRVCVVTMRLRRSRLVDKITCSTCRCDKR